MREMPYIEPYRIDGRRDGDRGILDEFRVFYLSKFKHGQIY